MRAAAEFKKKHQLYIRYAYANLKDSDDAEVIVQDAYVLALEKEIDIFSEEGRRRLWKTLKYLVLKKNRKKRNEQEATERYTQEETGVSVEEYVTEEKMAVWDAGMDENLDMLYPGLSEDKNFQIVKKVYIDGHSIMDCAKEWDCTYEAAKKRVARARQAVRERIEKERKREEDS